ncbi:carbohydrate ABC transporter permease [Catenulispora sp. NF23]|uniref:Carbohydrate ABC transporter permease n=1 Tax=Catenulispora pinistramenti TaxID=2705254 RepID=A0ABS5KKI3_9ACTN|nr:carbohydrate ABC transporter permease [Catenulispora pinistramenti]MBS2533232.1 carbohydrate ABC transporter permease [Catenulispora pinistramenti]MBS2546566.1 carbohydrate ABC transporter permease [Catenulispora pinistramenti]
MTAGTTTEAAETTPAREAGTHPGRRDESRAPWVRPLVALIVTALFAVPLYLVVVNVFKPGGHITGSPASIPWPPTLDNLKATLDRPDNLYWDGLINSVEITAVSIVVLAILSAMLGHYLARTRSRFARVMLLVLLAGLMVPPQVILVPVVRILRLTHLMTTLTGMVAFNVGYYIPFGVFVFAGFIRSIPIELEEAAALDGAGRWRTFWIVIFPLLRPATASVLIFLGVWIWNDFLDPLIILGPVGGTTVTVGVYRALGEHQSNYGQLFGLMFLAALPVVIFYFLLQKHFVKGLTGGAVKG